MSEKILNGVIGVRVDVLDRLIEKCENDSKGLESVRKMLFRSNKIGDPCINELIEKYEASVYESELTAFALKELRKQTLASMHE